MNNAVLLMAYGGPDTLQDIPAYLLNIRNGRETPQTLVDEITHRYRRIGGRSPLLPITRNVAAKLQTVLEIPVYVGMRHWHPTIHETVTQMAADGVEICTAIVMAPHYSRMSVGAYRNMLHKSLAEIGAPMAVDTVESWGMQPEYLDGIVAAILEAMTRFPPAARDEVHVIFTAHSLPAAILADRRSVRRAVAPDRRGVGGASRTDRRALDVLLPERAEGRYPLARPTGRAGCSGAGQRGVSQRIGRTHWVHHRSRRDSLRSGYRIAGNRSRPRCSSGTIRDAERSPRVD